MLRLDQILSASIDDSDMLHHLTLADALIDFNVPYFCLSCSGNLLYTNLSLDVRRMFKNGNRVSHGIRGAYFENPQINEFSGDEKKIIWYALYQSLFDKKGDCLKRHLFRIDEIDALCKKYEEYKSGFCTILSIKYRLYENIKSTRRGYITDNPERDKELGLYVELNEIKKILGI